MNSLILIAVGNIIVWGIIVGLMFRLAAGERNLSADLADLEKRIKGS
jgi:hypothetical protein